MSLPVQTTQNTENLLHFRLTSSLQNGEITQKIIDHNAPMYSSYPNKQRLFQIAVFLSILFWLGLLGFGHAMAKQYLAQLGLSDFEIRRFLPTLILITLVTIFIVDRVHRIRLVTRLRAFAVEIGPKQFPDLHGRIKSVCRRLEIADLPMVFLYPQTNLADSTSVRYRGKDYLMLDAETVGALTDRQSAIDYLLGFELARLHDPNSDWRYFLWPARVVPLLGAAYERARIYHYDGAGIQACKTKVDAALGLAIRVAGTRRWKSLSIPQFASQSAEYNKLWMSFSELISARPWLPKRMAHLRATATRSDTFIPRRNPVSYLMALFVPYIQLTKPAGLFQLVFILFWISLASFWGDIGYNQLQQRGWLEWMGDKKEAPKVAFFTRAWLQKTSPEQEITSSNRYLRLHTDLRQLGKLASTRYKKYGDVPCEAGNIRGIKLNYRSSRYAYSCEEPIVYTRVAHGEFEPGRPAHVQSYNWEKNRILESALFKENN